MYEFNVPTFGKGVVFDVDHKVRGEQFRFFAEALKTQRMRLYVPQFVQEAQAGPFPTFAALPYSFRPSGQCTSLMATAVMPRSSALHAQQGWHISPGDWPRGPTKHQQPVKCQQQMVTLMLGTSSAG